MKTLLLIMAATSAVLLPSDLNAAEPLLSPRAKANQSITVQGATGDKLDRSLKSLSPRALESQPAMATGSTAETIDRSNPLASPRALANWPHLARHTYAGKSDLKPKCKMCQ